MSVYIKKVSNYDLKIIKEAITDAIVKIKFSLNNKKTAILKPNLVVAVPPTSPVITHPIVTRAVAEVLLEAGVRDIAIIESPGLGQVPGEVFEKTGYLKLAQELNVKILSLDELELVKINWKYGKVMLPRVVLEADLYINLPKLKTHCLTVVTLSIKNQKGLVPAEWKKLIHKLGLQQPVVELLKVISPHLVVMDGIEGMEGEGPLKGKRIKSRVLIIGDNALETDIVGSRIMGIKETEVEHLRYALNEGLGDLNPSVFGDDIALLIKPFKRANPEWGRILKVSSRRNPYACSMCVDSLREALNIAIKSPFYWKNFIFLVKFAYYAIFKGINIVQGLNTTYIPSKGWTVCFGKCTRKVAQKYKFTYLPNCPPSAAEVLTNFFKKPTA